MFAGLRGGTLATSVRGHGLMAQLLPQATPLSQCEENLNWGLFLNDIICFTDLNRVEYIVLYSMQVVKTNDVIHKQCLVLFMIFSHCT